MKLMKVAFNYDGSEIVGYIKPDLKDSFDNSTGQYRKMAHCEIAINRNTDKIIKNPCISTENLIEFLVTDRVDNFKL